VPEPTPYHSCTEKKLVDGNIQYGYYYITNNNDPDLLLVGRAPPLPPTTTQQRESRAHLPVSRVAE